MRFPASEPASYVGDSRDPDNVSVYTNEEKVRKAMRARVLNPDWLDSMEEHGYKGAGDLSTTVDVALGWDATTGVVSDTLWENLADAYAFDEDRQEWLRDVNPWALERSPRRSSKPSTAGSGTPTTRCGTACGT